MATRKTPANPDAIQLLTADHREVEQCFGEYDKLVQDDAAERSGEKAELAQRICAMLQVHTTLEEEIFYPAAREAMEEQDLLDEAEVEHASAKELIAAIMGSGPDEALYDARVTVLGEYIKHHVKEEEKEMFPKLKKTGIDLAALGAQMMERKQALTAEVGLGEGAEARA